MYISIADEPNAAAYFDKLISKFGQSAGIAAAVENVAQEYLELRNTQKAYEKFHYILEHWPESDRAIWAKTGMAMSRIRGLDLEAGESELLELLDKYSQDKKLPDAVHEIVEEYRNAGAYTEGREVFEYLLENPFEGAGTMLELQVGIALQSIKLGEPNKAEAAIDKLIADYNDHPNLAKGLFQIGENYYERANWYEHREEQAKWKEYLEHAIAIWAVILYELPVGGYTEQSCYFTGYSYQLMGEYDSAIDYYQQVVANWPAGKQACEAQYRVALCYHELRMNGAMELKEAIAKKHEAVNKVVRGYPDCIWVGQAMGLVGGRENFKLSEEGEAK